MRKKATETEAEREQRKIKRGQEICRHNDRERKCERWETDKREQRERSDTQTDEQHTNK